MGNPAGVFKAVIVTFVVGMIAFVMFPDVNVYIQALLSSDSGLPAAQQMPPLMRLEVSALPYVFFGAVFIIVFVLFRKKDN